jgi:hypothetical protein
MVHKLSFTSILLLFLVQYNLVFAQKNTAKVIVPTIEYADDNFEKASEKKTSVPNYGSGAILLENNHEDLFEDYEGKAAIDDKPEYRSSNTFILEKIVYTETEIIFSLAIYFPPKPYMSITFHPRNHQHHWFLKDLSTGKKHAFKSVRNIRKNGNLEFEELKDFPIKIEANKDIQSVFTCRVHFDRLPNSSKEVHLIEGRKKSKDHFNFFNIKLK